MRRSDFDITDKIRTTDPIEVCDRTVALFQALYPDGSPRPMRRAFAGVSKSSMSGRQNAGDIVSRYSRQASEERFW